MSAPQKTSYTDLSFSTALDHAIHIRRLYQHLLGEMKHFEAAWGKNAEKYYEKNYFLEDMHQAFIYLREAMDFRDVQVLHDTEASDLTSKKTESQPQYKPTLPVTKPFMAPSERRGENPPANQVANANPENATAGPSQTGINSDADNLTTVAGHRSSEGKEQESQSDEARVHSEVSESTRATRNHSSKGKERKYQSDAASIQNDDRVVPAAALEGLTELAGVPKDNDAASDGGPGFVRQEFRRNYTTVGVITADTDRYQAPPNHPPVPLGGTYRLTHNARQTSAPTTYENFQRGSSRRGEESRTRSSTGPETTRNRRQASSHHPHSNPVPSSSRRPNHRSRLRSPILDVGAMPQNEAELSEVSHDKGTATGKRRRNDEAEEGGDRCTRSQKRCRKD